MVGGDAFGLLLGAVLLGAVHGVEPGHGWPVAASYALGQSHTWLSGFVASLLIGVGHLVSSVAMVATFFYARDYFDLTQVNEPIAISGGVQIGGPVSLVAGVLLLVLGIREYRHGHAHANHGGDNDDRHDDHHDHDDRHGESHSHVRTTDDGHHGNGGSEGRGREDGGLATSLRRRLPFGSGHGHSHAMRPADADRGLLGIAWFAFVLGFAHEEEFEIVALCAGSNYCLELMLAYAGTVIVGIVGLTMLLLAGYHSYEERVERYAPYLPTVSAVVLVTMGLGFLAGVL